MTAKKKRLSKNGTASEAATGRVLAAKQTNKMNRALSKGTWRYYSTFRGQDFDPNLWKESLPLELVREVQENHVCKKVLERLEYELFEEEEETLVER